MANGNGDEEVGTEVAEKPRKVKSKDKDKAAKKKSPRIKADLENLERDKNGNLSAKGLPCLFSGQNTITPSARFLPGYDAKMKSLLLRITRGEEDASMDDIQPQALPFLMDKAGLVGFRIKNGKVIQMPKAEA